MPRRSPAWHAALECDPEHVGARKGLAFVAFRARDFTTAERHLELAAMQAPHDATVLAALDRVRSVQPGAPSRRTRRGSPIRPAGVLLYDMQGMRLAGGVGDDGDEALADAVAAEGAGLTREAARAARLLGLGRTRHLVDRNRRRADRDDSGRRTTRRCCCIAARRSRSAGCWRWAARAAQAARRLAGADAMNPDAGRSRCAR